MSSQIAKKPLPYLALILAHLIWGANFVVAKITLQEFPPMSLIFLRFAFACFFLAPFLISASKKVKISKQDLPKLIAVGVFAITLNISLFFEGLKRTTAIDASVLTLTLPMFSVLFGWWFLKEKVYFVNLIGIFLGLLGSLVIIGFPQIFTGIISPEAFLGNILIILASICWVVGAVISKPLLSKYSSLVVTGVAFIVGTVTMLIPSAFEYYKNPGWSSQITILGFLGLGYMILLSSISAYFLFEWGLSKTSVVVADLFQYIEPAVATTLAVLVLGEKISHSFLIGALLIGAGVFMGTLAKQELHHRRIMHKH